MSNYNLCKGVDSIDRKSFWRYLRSESVKKLINPSYKMDKSFSSFVGSKFYDTYRLKYNQYLREFIDDSILYTEYLTEKI